MEAGGGMARRYQEGSHGSFPGGGARGRPGCITWGVIGGTGSNERSVRRWKSTARLSVGKSGDPVEGEDGLVDAALVGFDRAFELFALAV